MDPTNREEPWLGTRDTVLRRELYQSLEPVRRPPWWGVDLDPASRPGVPKERQPRAWHHARFPPEHQAGEPSSPLHGRSNKSMPPVFGTAVPLRGLAGAIRRLAYRSPDHLARHWVLLMFGDRVEVWGSRFKALMWLGIPVAMAIAAGRLARR